MANVGPGSSAVGNASETKTSPRFSTHRPAHVHHSNQQHKLRTPLLRQCSDCEIDTATLDACERQCMRAPAMSIAVSRLIGSANCSMHFFTMKPMTANATVIKPWPAPEDLALAIM